MAMTAHVSRRATVLYFVPSAPIFSIPFPGCGLATDAAHPRHVPLSQLPSASIYFFFSLCSPLPPLVSGQSPSASAKKKKKLHPISFGWVDSAEKSVILLIIITLHSAFPDGILSFNHFPSPFNCSRSNASSMMSLRSMARSAPRLLSRTTIGSALRPCMAATPSSSLSKAAAVSAWPSSFQSFSTTPGRRSVVAGETDQELSAKLDSEIQIEDDIKANEQEPASVKDFLANSPFELKDEPGQEAVKLVRSFGDEVFVYPLPSPVPCISALLFSAPSASWLGPPPF